MCLSIISNYSIRPVTLDFVQIFVLFGWLLSNNFGSFMGFDNFVAVFVRYMATDFILKAFGFYTVSSSSIIK